MRKTVQQIHVVMVVTGSAEWVPSREDVQRALQNGLSFSENRFLTSKLALRAQLHTTPRTCFLPLIIDLHTWNMLWFRDSIRHSRSHLLSLKADRCAILLIESRLLAAKPDRVPTKMKFHISPTFQVFPNVFSENSLTNP